MSKQEELIQTLKEISELSWRLAEKLERYWSIES